MTVAERGRRGTGEPRPAARMEEKFEDYQARQGGWAAFSRLQALASPNR